MELAEAIRNRRSLRQFRKTPVTDDMVSRILDAGKAAPSAGNLQARDFFVVEDHDTREQLAVAALQQILILQAPVVIVVCANLEKIAPYGRRGIELYCLQDAAAAVQNILLTAHDLGLGACWIGAFDESSVTRVLRLPEHLRPVALIPIGWSAEKGQERKKRTDDVHFVRNTVSKGHDQGSRGS